MYVYVHDFRCMCTHVGVETRSSPFWVTSSTASLSFTFVLFSCLLGCFGGGGWAFLCWRKDLLLNLNIVPGWLTGPWASGIFLYLSLHLPLCTGVTDVCCCTSVHYVDSGDLNPSLLHLRCGHFTSWATSPALFSAFCFLCMHGFVPHSCFRRLFCSTLYSWPSPAWIPQSWFNLYSSIS